MSVFEARKLVNRLIRVDNLLEKYYGLDVTSGSPQIRCPFPTHEGDDQSPSARFYPESNSVFCFAEQRTFTAYDILKFLGFDDDVIFQHVTEYLEESVVEIEPEERKDIEIPETVISASMKFRKGGEFSTLIGEINGFFEQC
jgi:hypothetical protein